jgi:hypothetical protein
VLAAAGIYGAIARKTAQCGDKALDRRITTSRLAKLGFVARALIQAILPAAAAQPGSHGDNWRLWREALVNRPSTGLNERRTLPF